tara:strand:+ start:861 stop:1547 length:687 start_codon:yes stop_codon:yes gene_type:complete
MAREFRFGGAGGWNVLGSVNTKPGTVGFGFTARMSDVNLRAFMKDMKERFPQEMQQIITQSLGMGMRWAREDGDDFFKETGARPYRIIADSLRMKVLDDGDAGGRVFTSPEGTGPKGSRGVKLAHLFSQDIPPWDYGFDFNKQNKPLIVDSSNFKGAKPGLFLLSPPDKKFPGIGFGKASYGNLKKYNWPDRMQPYTEYILERKLREWINSTFKVKGTVPMRDIGSGY